MSAYNTVLMPVTETCTNCGSIVQRRVQFKYGHLRAYDYVVGETVRLVDGEAAPKAVSALGHAEPCPVCGYDLGGVFVVMIREGVISGVERGSTDRFIKAGHATYIVES